MFLIVGTFTGQFMGGAKSEGIYVFDFDPVSGAARRVQVAAGLHSPSYLARHPTLPIIYAAERQWSQDDKDEGALTSFAFFGATGQISQIARRKSGGAFTAHVRVSPDGKWLAAANPLGPNVAVFALGRDGTVGDEVTRFAFVGVGARERQSAPWPHSCWFTPDSKRMFVCDLGLDRVFQYDLTDGVQPGCHPFAQLNSGAGTRHAAVSADGRFLYVAGELDCSVSVFAHDAPRGSLAVVQTLPSVPEADISTSQPAEIILSRDGRFLYVTNRGHESVGIFAVNSQTGRLAPAGHVATSGNTPRHIALSQDGLFAFVANQLSGELVVFAVDLANGALTPTGMRIAVPSPSCVVAV